MNTTHEHNELKGFYLQNLMLLGMVTVIVVLPFALHKFVIGMYDIATIVFLFIILSLLNSYCIYKHKHILVPYWVTYSIKVFSLTYFMNLGVYALFWTYPLYFIIFFVQQRFSARLMSLIAFVSFSFMAITLFEIELVIRYVCTSLLLIVFCDLLVGVLLDYQRQLSGLVYRDPLTDTFNRRFMDTILENAVEESSRQHTPVSLLLFDLDNFKDINDQYGHHIGDKALTELVKLINLRKRKVDYLFRMGGEEFAIMLKNTELKNAYSLAESIRLEVEEADLITPSKITISIGVAELQRSESTDDWIRRADIALYKAKHQGRNKVCCAENVA